MSKNLWSQNFSFLRVTVEWLWAKHWKYLNEIFRKPYFFGFFSISCFSLLKLNQIILNNTSKDRARFALQNCIFRLCIKNLFTRPIKVQCSKALKIFCDFLLFSRKKCQKMFGPRIISYGFDRAWKAAQDVLNKISKKYARSTFIWPKRVTSII